MLVKLSEYKRGLIKLMQGFEALAIKNNMPCQVVATDNHPYLNKYTLKNPYLVVIKTEHFGDVFEHYSRNNCVCEFVNEIFLHFQVYFFSFQITNVNDEPYDTVLDLYGLFSDFLYCNTRKFKIIKDIEVNVRQLKIKYFVHATTNMLNNGMLNINSNYSAVCYVCNQGFVTNIQAQEINVGGNKNA